MKSSQHVMESLTKDVPGGQEAVLSAGFLPSIPALRTRPREKESSRRRSLWGEKSKLFL